MAKFMRGALCIALFIAAASCTSEADTAEAQVQAAGTIGCRYWRMRSITKAVGQYWQVSQFQLFESADGSGAETKGKAISSTHKGKPAVGSGLPDTSETKAEKATDGNAKTFWSASSDLKFEWIGVEFDKPKDIRSIKAQLSSPMMGPTMVIVEKSMDGEIWSRVNEIANMQDWGKKLQLYPLITMDRVPKSVFALRSQKNPVFCLGVKPTPNAEDPEADPFPIFENAALEVQKCDDNKNTQYWQLAGGQTTRLKNAADQNFVLHMDKGASGAKLSVKKCSDGCKDFTNDVFAFADGAKGGLMRAKDANSNLVITAAALKEGSAVTMQECADIKDPKEKVDAEVSKCSKLADKTLAQFELKPMFVIEKGKQSIACAPYSHSHAKPTPCNKQVVAQELCAKDNKCSAYNWVDATPMGGVDGVSKNAVYLCTDLHEVHSGVAGWELGVRAGRLEPFVEEAQK